MDDQQIWHGQNWHIWKCNSESSFCLNPIQSNFKSGSLKLKNTISKFYVPSQAIKPFISYLILSLYHAFSLSRCYQYFSISLFSNVSSDHMKIYIIPKSNTQWKLCIRSRFIETRRTSSPCFQVPFLALVTLHALFLIESSPNFKW